MERRAQKQAAKRQKMNENPVRNEASLEDSAPLVIPTDSVLFPLTPRPSLGEEIKTDSKPKFQSKNQLVQSVLEYKHRGYSSSVNQQPDIEIKCPNVSSIENTQAFLQTFKRRITPGPPAVIYTNRQTEIGLLAHFTPSSTMLVHEKEELGFLTTTFIQLGKFYPDQKTESMISGTRKVFPWGIGRAAGLNEPITTVENKQELDQLLSRLPKIQEIICKRFKRLAPGIYEKSIEKMKEETGPNKSDSDTINAEQLSATEIITAWGDFYDRAHINDSKATDYNITYGGFCGVEECSGKLAIHGEKFGIKFGQFVFPGISTVVGFDQTDGWTDLFWNSKALFHQSVRSQKPDNCPFTRFSFSVNF
ncbi:hypothetical protein MJO29_002201 [Puccinia striiformis f. sp. tritici]|nr:hypothetical protein MJO29_002201 [Puccinia striiformis f. sp. tritici]KAI9617765.1 hypothetical protein KEM48_007011 [Puccinia striiformis f. sp. tritici PST-130]